MSNARDRRLMAALLLDTNVILRAGEDRRHEVSPSAIRMVDDAAVSSDLALSAISFLEISTLAEKGVISVDAGELYAQAREDGIRVIPLDVHMALRAGRLPAEGFVGRDPADRMIVATAILTGCDLFTLDREMIAWNGPLRVIDARA